MCEKPPFRRWLVPASVEAIRTVPVLVMALCSATIKILLKVRNPAFEVLIGISGIISSLTVPFLLTDVTFYTRAFVALCVIPSFIVFMHGEYRERSDYLWIGDC